MKERLQELETEALGKVEKSGTIDELKQVRVEYLGKKGPITEVLRGMGKLSKEERPVIGQLANDVREKISDAIDEKQTKLEDEALEEQLKEESIDVTLPGRPVQVGGPHLLTSIIEEIEDLFLGMGFEIKEGPEVETDYYNFEALNLPKGHPARDMQDTFYITEELLMRTHTSPVQARTMGQKNGTEPVKMIVRGKCTAEIRMTRPTPTSSHRLKDCSWMSMYV